MSLAAGKLRHRIEIHALTSAQDDATGNITETWSLFADAWADVQFVSGIEYVKGGAQAAQTTVSVLIRYIPGVKRSMRIRHGERIFNIHDVLPDKSSGAEYLTMPCSEVVND